jgi:hypothetical protein
MGKKFTTLGAFIIASAIIWGAVIIGCSYALKGTECYEKIQNILAAGASFHIILIWGPLSLLLFKKTKEK